MFKVIIRDKMTKTVSIKKIKKKITAKDIDAMLRAMPKKVLAEALGIQYEEKNDEGK